ncbi:MAG: vWA domain-containing protein, partial [Bythopirellula sp.]
MKLLPLPGRTSRRIVRRASRRGAMLILVCLLSVILIAAVAFSVDVAYMQHTRTKLRVATDASARAAGEAFSRLQSLTAAKQAAKSVALANVVAGEPMELADSDIVEGNTAFSGGGHWAFTPHGTPTNSIRVNGRRTAGSQAGVVPLFFGRVLGVDDFEPEMQATVVRLDRDICVVVDRSSSMKLDINSPAETMGLGNPRICQPPQSDSRWAALESAVGGFLSALASTPQSEHVALVSYASDFTRCGVTNNDADINQVLDYNESLVGAGMSSISASVFNGATNIAAGIDGGVTVLTDAGLARPFAAKTMILFTDGHRTAGRQPRDAALDAAAENIMIHTITFGNGANQPQMEEVATITGGKHYHAPDAVALAAIFQEIAFTLPVIMT